MELSTAINLHILKTSFQMKNCCSFISNVQVGKVKEVACYWLVLQLPNANTDLLLNWIDYLMVTWNLSFFNLYQLIGIDIKTTTILTLYRIGLDALLLLLLVCLFYFFCIMKVRNIILLVRNRRPHKTDQQKKVTFTHSAVEEYSFFLLFGCYVYFEYCQNLIVTRW